MTAQSPIHTSILQRRSPPPAPESLSANSLTSALLPKLQQLRPAQLVTTLRALASLHHRHPHTLEQLAHAVMLADSSHASHDQTRSSTQQQQQQHPDQLHWHSHQPAYSQTPYRTHSHRAKGTSAFSPRDWGHILSAFSTLRHEPQLLLPHAARVIAASLHDTNIHHTSHSQATASGTAAHGHVPSLEATDGSRPPSGTNGQQQRALLHDTSSDWGAADLAGVLLPFALLQHHAPHLFGSAASRLFEILHPFDNSSARTGSSLPSSSSDVASTNSTSSSSSSSSTPGTSGDRLFHTIPPPRQPDGPSPGSSHHHQSHHAARVGDGKLQDPSKLVTCLWAYASLADPAVVGLAAAVAVHADSLLPPLRLPALCSLAWSLSVAVALSGNATAAASAAAAPPHNSEAGQGQPGWQQTLSPTTSEDATQQLQCRAQVPGAAVDAQPAAHAALPRSSETAAVLSLLQRVVAAAEPAATSQQPTQGVSSSGGGGNGAAAVAAAPHLRTLLQAHALLLDHGRHGLSVRAAAGMAAVGKPRRSTRSDVQLSVLECLRGMGLHAEGEAWSGDRVLRCDVALQAREVQELLERPQSAAERTHAATLSPLPRGSGRASGGAERGSAAWGEDRRRAVAPTAAEDCDCSSSSSGNARARRRAARSQASEDGNMTQQDGPAGLQGRLMQLQQRLQGGGLQAAALQALAAGGHPSQAGAHSSSGAGGCSIRSRDMGHPSARYTHRVSRTGEGTGCQGESRERVTTGVWAGRVAVEVDGPQHFCATSRLGGGTSGGFGRRRNGKTELRDALLRQRFSALVCVSTAEWRGVRGGEAGRRAYLTRLLMAASPQSVD